jgi:hypothetical protein
MPGTAAAALFTPLKATIDKAFRKFIFDAIVLLRSFIFRDWIYVPLKQFIFFNLTVQFLLHKKPDLSLSGIA